MRVQVLKSKQKGFTLIELSLATAFFTTILLFFVFGYIQVTRTFHKGNTIKKITESGRLVIEDMARNIRLSSSDEFNLLPASGGLAERVCVHGVRYAWNTGDVVDSTGDPLPAHEQVDVVDDAGSIVGDPIPFSLVRSIDPADCDERFEIKDGFSLEVSAEGDISTRGASSLLNDNVIVQALNITEILEGVEIDITLSTAGINNPTATGTPSEDARCDAAGFVKQGDHFCDVVRFKTFVSFRGS